jgi:sec-independent protein translocase protein TatA
MSLFAWFSPQDMLIIGVIALLLFGNRLPSVMRSLGQGVTEFKKGLEGSPEDDAAKKGEPKKLDDQPVKS